MTPIVAATCSLGLLIVLVALLFMARRLEETSREIEGLKKEVFLTNRLLINQLLIDHHPELSNKPDFVLEIEDERIRKSSLGKMLETAKENARGKGYLTHEPGSQP